MEEFADPRCYLATIAYLERNDYSKICQVNDHVMKAMDGTKHVYIWLTFSDRGLAPVPVPEILFRLAAHDKARVDIISIFVSGDTADLKHMMNVPA